MTNYRAWQALPDGLNAGIKAFQDARSKREALELKDREFGLQEQAMQAKASKEQREAAGMGDPFKIASRETELRKEGQNIFGGKDVDSALSSFSNIERAGKDATGASDMAMLYSFVKMLDPGSVVRESEFGMAQNAGSWWEKAKALAQKADPNNPNAPILTPQQRGDFIKAAQDLFVGAGRQYMPKEQQFMDLLASESKMVPISPERIHKPRFTQQAFTPELWQLLTQQQAIGSSGPDAMKRQRAQQALNDPEATPQEKAQAMKILGGQSGQVR